MNRSPGSLLRCFSAIALLLLVWVIAAPLHAQITTASSGRDFWLALPSLEVAPGHLVRLNITAVGGGDVTVRLMELDSTITRSLSGGELWELVLPRTLLMLDRTEYTSRRSIHITSTQPVTVHLYSDADFVSEAYCVLPTPSLGYDYLVMSVPSVGFPDDEPNSAGGMMAVIATEDGTEVRITPTTMTSSGNPAGFTYGLTLKQGEVYQLLPRNPEYTDLTGTRVTSTRPVALLSGHRYLEYDSVDASNPLIEQMMPIVDWGRTFYSAPLPKNSHGHYRILASRDGTEIFFNGVNVARLDAAESRRFAVEGAITISSSAPVLVTQQTTTFPAGSSQPDGDPSMMLLNPVESYSQRFVWGTPSLPSRIVLRPDTVRFPFTHQAMITAPAEGRDAVRLDGAPVSFTIAHSDGDYYSAFVPLVPGPHAVTSPAPVNVQLFGYSLDDAYSLPAGGRLREPFRAESLLVRTCRDLLDTTIVVSNVGTRQIVVDSIYFTPGIDGRVIVPDVLPIAIPAPSSQLLRLRIDLPAFGTYSGSLIVRAATDGLAPLVVPVKIIRDSLAITINNDSLRFTEVTGARPTRDTTITVVNSGTGPVMITVPSATGPFVVIAPALPVLVEKGDTLTLRVRFQPSGAGEFSGSLLVAPQPCGDAVRVTMSGERLTPASISATAASIDPIVCPMPGYSDIPITISNAGGEPLRIDSIGIEGMAGDFSFPVSPDGTTIQGGDSTTILLRFTPTAPGERHVILRLFNRVSPSGYYFLSISARRDSLGLTPSTHDLDFGILDGCRSDTVRSIVIRNSGTVPITIDSTATSTDDFAVVGGPLTLEEGEATELMIRFAPQEGGERHDTLVLFDARCRTRTAISLSGQQTGVGLLVETDTLDLGVIAACDLPLVRTLRVTNSGGVSEQLTMVAIEGEGVQVGSFGDSTLLPTEARDIPLMIAVQPDGEITATLLVRVEPCGLERRVAIGGVVRTPTVAASADVDFGELSASTPQAASTWIVNNGVLPVTVDSLTVVPVVPGLRITAPSLPSRIAPGDTLTVVFEYASATPGEFIATVTGMIDQPCQLRPAFMVRGSRGEIVSLRLALPDTSAPVDARLGLPVTLDGTADIDGVLEVSGEIRWDYSMLSIDGIATSIVGAIVSISGDSVMGGERVVSFKYVGPPGEHLASLDAVVLLGLSDTTALRWSNVTVRHAEQSISINTRDGRFTTLGICRIGGDRYVRLTGITAIGRLVPNPAMTTASLEVVAASPVSCTLRILDYLGGEVTLPRTIDLDPGRHRIGIDVRSLRPGLYFYELHGGGTINRGEVVVVR